MQTTGGGSASFETTNIFISYWFYFIFLLNLSNHVVLYNYFYYERNFIFKEIILHFKVSVIKRFDFASPSSSSL